MPLALSMLSCATRRLLGFIHNFKLLLWCQAKAKLGYSLERAHKPTLACSTQPASSLFASFYGLSQPGANVENRISVRTPQHTLQEGARFLGFRVHSSLGSLRLREEVGFVLQLLISQRD